MELGRIYKHKEFGQVGSVVLNAPGIVLELDGKLLPDASVIAILRHGLQILQDAYAGAKNEAEAKGSFNKKYDKLIMGTMGERGISDEMSSIETEIAKAWAKVSGMTFAKGVPTAERYELAFAAWEKDATPRKAKVEAYAKSKVAADKVAADELAALAL